MSCTNNIVLVEGCRPCNFICSECKKIVYRCTTGELMYEHQYTHNVYCEDCFKYITNEIQKIDLFLKLL